MVILRFVVQKLYVAENCLPPGLSIANLRQVLLKNFQKTTSSYHRDVCIYLTKIQTDSLGISN